MKAHFQLMDRYNRWFNGQLLAACKELTDSQRKQDMQAFFGSIHATLNHILLADKLWLGRFSGQPFAVTGLDQQLHDDFDALCEDRRQTDQAISRIVSATTSWESNLTFTDTFGVTREIPTHQAIGHIFNHATHHRGQITTLLAQLGVDVGITDLARMPADFV